MQQIKCPWCGTRDELEFTCGGELVSRPTDALASSDDEWTNYLYFRVNALGDHCEVWRHTHGCRQWFKVQRNTLTHAVRSTCRISEDAVEGNTSHG